jgi:Fe-S cluster assembly iron-binding protein IscA
VTLDESEKGDNLVTVDDVRVSVEPGVLPYVEDYVIDLIEAWTDKRLIIMDPDLMC